MPVFGLPDPEQGQKLFVSLYGSRGRRWFRRVLYILVPLAVIVALLYFVGQITGSLDTIASTVHRWFAAAPVSRSPESSGDCVVSGGNNYGHLEQHCGLEK